MRGWTVAVLLCALVVPLVHGESTVETGRVEWNLFKVEGFVSGVLLKIDREYARKHGLTALPAPFTFIAPKRPHTFVLYPPESGQALIKLSFGTDDKQFIENLQFVNMAVPMVEPEQRIAITTELLHKKGLPMAFKGYQDPKHLETYVTKVGGNDAVTVHAQFMDPGKGLHYVKMVGIINPRGEHCIMAVSFINPCYSEVRNGVDLRDKGIGTRCMHSVRFIE